MFGGQITWGTTSEKKEYIAMYDFKKRNKASIMSNAVYSFLYSSLFIFIVVLF